MTKMFRFTDWYNDDNDRYGTYDECLKIFKERVANNPEGRFSIYDTEKDIGIKYNEQCPEYKVEA
jgi:hypothetical protein